MPFSLLDDDDAKIRGICNTRILGLNSVLIFINVSISLYICTMIYYFTHSHNDIFDRVDNAITTIDSLNNMARNMTDQLYLIAGVVGKICTKYKDLCD